MIATRRAAFAIATVAATLASLAGFSASTPATAAGLTGAPAAGAAPAALGAAASPSPAATPRFTITLDNLEPKVAHKGDTLSVDGTLLNTSGETLTGVTVALRVSSQRIGTRYDLARDSEPATQLGVVISATRENIGTVGVGGSVSWQISVPVDKLGLPSSPAMFGAYPLAIEASSLGKSGTVRSRLPTTLMWMPDDAQFTPTLTSWLWPVVDGIHRGATDTFLDDTLAHDLAPAGRVGQLVAVAADSHLPVTYFVDPALVDDATAMAASAPDISERPGAASSSPAPGTSPGPQSHETAPAGQDTSPAQTKKPKPAESASPAPSPTPYQVGSGTKTKPGSGAAVAAGWLAQLRSAVGSAGSALVALPYGDADLVALDRAGLDKEIALARTTGQALLSSELAAPTLPDVVWPVGGVVNVSTLADLATDMVTTVVLDGSAVQAVDPNAVTSPRTDLQTASGTVHAVVSDPTLDALIADPGSVAGGQRAAEQRFLAETMLITEARPGSGSSVVLTPPRDADPSNHFLATVLADSGAVPWLKLTGLGDIADQPSDGIARQPLSYPAVARRAELPGYALAPIDDLRTALADFGAVLGSSNTDPFFDLANLAILRAESSGWRTAPETSAQLTNEVRAELRAQTSKVFVTDPRLITLTSRKQKIPITIVNELPEPVTLQLQVTAVNAARLTVTPIEPFTVDGKGSRHEVLLEVEATTNGRFQVQAQLMTPDGSEPFGSPVSFEVNSTAYGAVALAIAGSAAGLLFLLSGYRLFRRIRRKPGKPGTTDDGTAADTTNGGTADGTAAGPAATSDPTTTS